MQNESRENPKNDSVDPQRILRWCADAAPKPWFPSTQAETSNIERDDFDAPLWTLRQTGLIQVADWQRGLGQGFELTEAGKESLGKKIETEPAKVAARPTPLPMIDVDDLRQDTPFARGEAARLSALCNAATDRDADSLDDQHHLVRRWHYAELGHRGVAKLSARRSEHGLCRTRRNLRSTTLSRTMVATTQHELRSYRLSAPGHEHGGAAVDRPTSGNIFWTLAIPADLSALGIGGGLCGCGVQSRERHRGSVRLTLGDHARGGGVVLAQTAIPSTGGNAGGVATTVAGADFQLDCFVRAGCQCRGALCRGNRRRIDGDLSHLLATASTPAGEARRLGRFAVDCRGNVRRLVLGDA